MSENTAQNVQTQNLVFIRVFDAPVEQVWKAWREPELVRQWWGPNGFTSPSAEMDFRVGGISLVCMRAPKEFGSQDMYNTWKYTTIVPMQRIEYILNFSDKDGNMVEPATLGLPADMPGEVRNLVLFKDLGNGKTELTVTEFDWPIGHMMEMSKLGMERCLDKMAASLKSLA